MSQNVFDPFSGTHFGARHLFLAKSENSPKFESAIYDQFCPVLGGGPRLRHLYRLSSLLVFIGLFDVYMHVRW